MKLALPDITSVQKAVAAGAVLLSSILGLVAAFGVTLSAAQIAAIGGAYAALGSFLVLADAIIRNGRSRAMLRPDVEIKSDAPSAGSGADPAAGIAVQVDGSTTA